MTATTRMQDIQPPHKQALRDHAFHACHLIFNHVSLRTVQDMARKELIPLPPILKSTPPKLTCSGCANGKLRPQPHKKTTHRYAVAVSLSSDVCGPITPRSTHGNVYFMTFIDTKSKYAILYFMPSRKNILQHIVSTVNIIKRRHGQAPQMFTTDNAGEYISKAATQFYQAEGITLKPSTPYSPQENGIAERINSTLMTAARAALYHSKLPPVFWEEVVRDVCFKYNPTRTTHLNNCHSQDGMAKLQISPN